MTATLGRLGTQSSYLGADGGFGLAAGATTTAPTVAARLTQAVVEALVVPAATVRLSQAVVEALVRSTSTVRMTQATVEVLVLEQASMLATQAPIEVVYRGDPNLRTTQAPVEVVASMVAGSRITQAALEVVFTYLRRRIPLSLWVMARYPHEVPLSMPVRGRIAPIAIRLSKAFNRNVPLTIQLGDARPGWHVTTFGIEVTIDPRGPASVSQFVIEVLIPNRGPAGWVQVIGA